MAGVSSYLQIPPYLRVPFTIPIQSEGKGGKSAYLKVKSTEMCPVDISTITAGYIFQEHSQLEKVNRLQQ
jgi:hypothetical protein